MPSEGAMRVLGIDPGYARVGVAIISGTLGHEEVLYSGCVETHKNMSHEDRLREISTSLSGLVKKFSPTHLAIEKLFFNTNQKTAMQVSEAKGVLINTCQNAGMAVFEYTPLQIKVAITGDGRANKQAVAFMVNKLLPGLTGVKLDDEYDALAVALTHMASNKSRP